MHGTGNCSSSPRMVSAWSRTTGVAMADPAKLGPDMDGYADDLAAVIEALDLTEVTLVGHSTGGGEVARYKRRGVRPKAKLGLPDLDQSKAAVIGSLRS